MAAVDPIVAFRGLALGLDSSWTGIQTALRSPDFWKKSNATVKTTVGLFIGQIAVLGLVLAPIWAAWNSIAWLFPGFALKKEYLELAIVVFSNFIYFIPITTLLFFRYVSPVADKLFFGTFALHSKNLESFKDRKVPFNKRLSAISKWLKRNFTPSRILFAIVYVACYFLGYETNSVTMLVLESLGLAYLGYFVLGAELSIVFLLLNLTTSSTRLSLSLLKLITSSMALTTELLDPYTSRLDDPNWTLKKPKKMRYAYLGFGLLFNALLVLPLVSPLCWILAQSAAGHFLWRLDQAFTVL